MSHKKNKTGYPQRLLFLKLLMLLGVAALFWRMGDLNLNQREFLQGQGDARYLREVSIPAHRGMITDRHGEPLAISTPVESVWANPPALAQARERWPELARVLELEPAQLEQLLGRRMDREFVYLRRHINPDQAERVMALRIPGVSLQPEYRRYYPMGEVAAHVLGFTNIDDVGQEGIELMLDQTLRGTPGSKRVLRDRLGRIVENVESIHEPRPGDNLQLSIDRRIQYLAYRELKAAVNRHRASSGSAVVLDVITGEVLAMVNQPAYNPNNRSDLDSSRFRNRAVTDVFEPGSTMKPFTISAALESGKYRPKTPVDTHPGLLRLSGYTIRDSRDYGLIDVSTVIQKSSNVGASRIALSLEPQRLWDVFSRFGFGYDSGSGFPGEAAGLLNAYQEWRDVEQATVSYGYGLSVSTLQLAHAYATLAADGQQRPVSLLKLKSDNLPKSRQSIDPAIARAVRGMLELAVQKGGTGTRAQIAGYRVAGKTGTVRKAGVGGYSEENYISIFAGMAPASRPRLAMVVVVHRPDDGEYYGGVVAAPVFARVMEGALRLLDVAPDDLESLRGVKVARAEGVR
ncbi:MAG: penicillin-binding transpeptidase domain-containing protein [Gammaproteobacteria bacterium]|nr:penicillin-binding transpeptidase domain-containing protein [Gammaproteobacteria bacterium]MCW8840075.1 penicillin-binding transpeptidase domain-containing protein [Gammaproteobacteria bacterium]MCW8927959.1 penicillin-binding transpeptidase domain-containing protein [Gammaproteobacteria bacterium]MCW8959727.1 penicillin-binding transpeptidase domain-containing protein [Gammaproteobacteria bacterium]MCW8971924.1 penicillin-binding transpeptidase domain-containing protein [Gammaproteobacteria